MTERTKKEDQRIVRLYDGTGARLHFVRKKNAKGEPLCLTCKKVIPLRPSVKVPIERDLPRRSRCFCTQRCAAHFGEFFMEQLVRPDPELDLPGPDGKIIAGPVKPAKERLAQDAASRLRKGASALED
jgi:hypothetical protein